MDRRSFLQSSLAAAAPPQTATSRPNILLFCTDQQRFDTIHALGNEHIRTPNLDRLVNQGFTFTNAYCQTPICTPSRASFRSAETMSAFFSVSRSASVSCAVYQCQLSSTKPRLRAPVSAINSFVSAIV